MSQSSAAARWSALIDRQESSGQSIRAFAEANNLNARTLAWWRSRLGRSQRPRPTTGFLEVVVADAQLIDDSSTTEDPTVVLVLDAFPAHVVVDRQTDFSLLKQLLAALC